MAPANEPDNEPANNRPANNRNEIVARYAAAFAALTPASIDTLLDMLENDVRFVDPFNDVRGKPAFRAIFDHMFAVSDAPRFEVSDIAYSASNTGIAYLRWRMSGKISGWPYTSLNFEGMSEVHISPNGLISGHFDHWDSASQLLARLPVIGGVLRLVLRQFKVKTDEK
ncbi:nuclear transport factor 2 family protein [Alphaproteobacteria bacterium]|nr:nuclear transport factor 2 family protein [Alphaproteobacteria bacterium]